ncbi:NAD-binding protein [Rhizobium lusitanum]|uniref:NAD-binding protein n=1 Tax=Rhizobium lusitanum TaxID=293958 RepID=A0A6L9UEX5_9HYPH|nr:NAD(P)-dependent oxidoreductase [Rhizobium lusitanum]NEI72560.1 NAD-binding protein [Rhizobium lusitanum]
MPNSEHPASVVAFVGLGTMGAPMVRCLAKGGISLQLYDIDPDIRSRLAAEVRGVNAGSLSEFAGASVVILMLPNSQIVRQVCLGGDSETGGLAQSLSPGSLIIDMSSSDPSATRELGHLLKARGIAMADAPVSGGVRKAINGTLAVMLGSDDESALKTAAPILEHMGKVFHTGGLGSGHAIKALNNYVSAAGLRAACEAVIVAERFGLDPVTMIDVINASTGRNNSTENKIKPFVLTGDFRKAGFALELLAKDVGIAANLTRQLGLSLSGFSDARDFWKAAMVKLGAGADHTEIFRYLRDESGAEKNAVRP